MICFISYSVLESYIIHLHTEYIMHDNMPIAMCPPKPTLIVSSCKSIVATLLAHIKICQCCYQPDRLFFRCISDKLPYSIRILLESTLPTLKATKPLTARTHLRSWLRYLSNQHEFCSRFWTETLTGNLTVSTCLVLMIGFNLLSRTSLESQQL